MADTYYEIFKIGLYVVVSITFCALLFLIVKHALKTEEFKDLNLMQKLFGEYYIGVLILIVCIYLIYITLK